MPNPSRRSHWPWIAAGALAVVAAAFVWAGLFESPPPHHTEGTATTHTESLAETSQQAAPSDGDLANASTTAHPSDLQRTLEPQATPESDTESTATRHGWTGTARDAAGRPASGVALRWNLHPRASTSSIVHTDVNGNFFLPFPRELDWSPHAETGLCTVEPNWAPRVHTVPPPSSPPNKVELVLQSATAWLPVRVVDSDQTTPRANLLLMLAGNGHAYEARTDNDGYARLTGIPGVNLRLVQTELDHGWLQTPDPLILDPGENAEITVRFQGTPHQLELRAVNHRTGAPIEANWAQCVVFGEPPIPLAEHQHEFVWALNDVRELANRCELHVSADGFLPTQFEWSQASPRTPIDVRLEPEYALELPMRLLQGGEAIASESVRVSANGPHQSEQQTLKSRQGGLAPEAYSGIFLSDQRSTTASGDVVMQLPWTQGIGLPKRIRVEVMDYDWWLLTAALGPLPWTLELAPPTETLVIQLVDQDARPIPNQIVRIWWQPDGDSPLIWAARGGPFRTLPVGSQMWVEPDVETATDANGQVEIEAPVGVPFLWSTPKGMEVGELRKQPAIASGEQRVIRYAMGQNSTISGTVFRADGREWDGVPLTLELLDTQGRQVMNSDGSERANWASVRTNWNAGEFTFHGVPEGQYQLVVHAVDAQQDQIWVQAGQDDVEITLKALNKLKLRIVDQSSGKLISGETWAYIDRAVGGMSWATIWDGVGTIEFGSGKQIVLQLEAEGYTARSIALGEFNADAQVVERQFELVPGREVALRITPAAAVEDGRFAGLLIKDARGHDIADLPAGYRTDPGVVTLLSVPRDALQVWLLERGTRAVLQKIDIPASADGSKVDVAVRWR